MKNMLTFLAATAAVSLAAPAYAADESAQSKTNAEYKKDGGYESKHTAEHTTPDGTTHSSGSKVEVNVDDKGLIDKTVKTESTTDPKGLLNTQKDTSETEIKEKDRGGYEQTTIRKHTDPTGTNITYKTTTVIDVDDNGNVTTTATTEKTVDPQGLLNKKTSTDKTKSINGVVVEQKKDTY